MPSRPTTLSGKVRLVIFDADGVITTEARYWRAAELAVAEVLHGGRFIGLRDEDVEAAPPGRFVTKTYTERLKARGVVSNWDTAYFSCALFVIEAMKRLPPGGAPAGVAADGLTHGNIAAIGAAIGDKSPVGASIDELSAPLFDAADSLNAPPGPRALTDALNALSRAAGLGVEPFSHDDPLYDVCKTLFQEWFLGDALFAELHGEKLSPIAKPGLILTEEPIIPLEKLDAAFSALRGAGATLGIGTGRPRVELLTPLTKWNLSRHFDPARISTNREIEEAETWARAAGRPAQLAKPHPYVYLKAMFPEKSPEEILAMPLPPPGARETLIVGDTVADVAAAKAIGARAAAVVSTVKTKERLASIEAAGPDFIIDSVTDLPALFE